MSKASGQSGEKNFIDHNYIEVTGNAELEVAPDMIYLNITLRDRDSKVKISLAERESQMIAKLKDLGIDVSKDLMVSDLSSSYRDYLLFRSDVMLAKQYQLLVHDAKTAFQVLLELERLEIANVSIAKLDHSEMTRYKKEVKISAIRAAREKADDLAKAIGQDIGRALYVQEIEFLPSRSVYPQQRNSLSSVGAVHRGAPEAPELGFEKLILNYSILCRFELK